MALGSIPPWLNVSPSDFVRAAQMGAETGLAVARTRQAADQFAREMEFKQWEAQQAQELRREEMQRRAEQQKAQNEARLAYNLANIGIRQASQQNLAQFRESQKQRLLDTLSLQQNEEKRRVEQEERRKKQAETAAAVWSKKEQIKALYHALSLEGDLPKQAMIQEQIDKANDELQRLSPGASALDPNPQPPPQTYASAPTEQGAQPIFKDTGTMTGAPSPVEGISPISPGITSPEQVPGPESMFPLPAPSQSPQPAPATVDDSGWEQRGKWRIRKAPGTTAKNAPTPSPVRQSTEDREPPPVESDYSTAQGFDSETGEPYMNEDDKDEEEEEEDK